MKITNLDGYGDIFAVTSGIDALRQQLEVQKHT